MFLRRLVLLFAAATLCAQADVSLVVDGRPMAIIVTADHPTQVVSYATEELVRHVERTAGVKLEVMAESVVKPEAPQRIYIGDSREVRAAGINVEKLAAEA